MGYSKIPHMCNSGDITGANTVRFCERETHRIEGRMGSHAWEIWILAIFGLASRQRTMEYVAPALFEVSEPFAQGCLLPQRRGRCGRIPAQRSLKDPHFKWPHFSSITRSSRWRLCG